MTTLENDVAVAPARLSPAALAAIGLPKAEREAHIRKKKWFGYQLAAETLDKLDDLLTYPRSDRMTFSR